jgi:hypothetical protein
MAPSAVPNRERREVVAQRRADSPVPDLSRLPDGPTAGRGEPSTAGPHDPAQRPPSPADLAWTAAIATIKAAIIALAIDAFVNSSSPRFSGKGMKIRAVGYAGSLLLVPLAWRLRGRKEPYPRALDLAVAVPLLADAAGNAIGIYQRAHVDDAIHFANGALTTALVGAIATPRTRTPWEAAGLATATGMAAAALWEMLEWVGLKLGAKGMDLSYDDTMEDLIETSAGAVLGGLVTLLRHPVRLRTVPGRSGDPIVSPTGAPRSGTTRRPTAAD